MKDTDYVLDVLSRMERADAKAQADADAKAKKSKSKEKPKQIVTEDPAAIWSGQFCYKARRRPMACPSAFYIRLSVVQSVSFLFHSVLERLHFLLNSLQVPQSLYHFIASEYIPFCPCTGCILR
jgi:hypothetical protein